VWQQTGFFKNREYAEDLSGKLEKLGFKPVIREEKRPSGTIYFSVLVPEDADRTAEKRLKDAGFESYLLID
jgi:cell division protein FtsN